MGQTSQVKQKLQKLLYLMKSFVKENCNFEYI